MAPNDVYGWLRLPLASLTVAQPSGMHAIAERLTHKEIAHRIGGTREGWTGGRGIWSTGPTTVPAGAR